MAHGDFIPRLKDGFNWLGESALNIENEGGKIRPFGKIVAMRFGSPLKKGEEKILYFELCGAIPAKMCSSEHSP